MENSTELNTLLSWESISSQSNDSRNSVQDKDFIFFNKSEDNVLWYESGTIGSGAAKEYNLTQLPYPFFGGSLNKSFGSIKSLIIENTNQTYDLLIRATGLNGFSGLFNEQSGNYLIPSQSLGIFVNNTISGWTIPTDKNRLFIHNNSTGSINYSIYLEGISSTSISTTTPESTFTYYVATNGSDSNSGTIDSPWKSIKHAHDNTTSGCTIYFRSGEYSMYSGTWWRMGDPVARRGVSGNPIIYRNYNNEEVTWNGGLKQSWTACGTTGWYTTLPQTGDEYGGVNGSPNAIVKDDWPAISIRHSVYITSGTANPSLSTAGYSSLLDGRFQAWSRQGNEVTGHRNYYIKTNKTTAADWCLLWNNTGWLISSGSTVNTTHHWSCPNLSGTYAAHGNMIGSPVITWVDGDVPDDYLNPPTKFRASGLLVYDLSYYDFISHNLYFKTNDIVTHDPTIIDVYQACDHAMQGDHIDWYIFDGIQFQYSKNGCSVGGSGNSIFRNCAFKHNEGCGMYISHNNNLIENCYFDFNGTLSWRNSLQVYDNGLDHTIYGQGTQNTYRNNFIGRNMGGYGGHFFTISCTGLAFYDNVFYDDTCSFMIDNHHSDKIYNNISISKQQSFRGSGIGSTYSPMYFYNGGNTGIKVFNNFFEGGSDNNTILFGTWATGIYFTNNLVRTTGASAQFEVPYSGIFNQLDNNVWVADGRFGIKIGSPSYSSNSFTDHKTYWMARGKESGSIFTSVAPNTSFDTATANQFLATNPTLASTLSYFRDYTARHIAAESVSGYPGNILNLCYPGKTMDITSNTTIYVVESNAHINIYGIDNVITIDAGNVYFNGNLLTLNVKQTINKAYNFDVTYLGLFDAGYKIYIENITYVPWGILPPGEWDLIFSDEFDGDAIDANKWIISSENVDTHSNPATSYHVSSRWPENVKVESGILKLITKKEKRGQADWTAAHVMSKSFLAGSGYYEARVKNNGLHGLNNAFWTMGYSGGTTSTYEMDIIENHYPREITSTINKYRPSLTSEGLVKNHTSNLDIDYHIFGLEINNNSGIWYMDGVPYLYANLPMSGYSGELMDIRFSTMVNNQYGGNIVDALSGSIMEVDGVHFWRKKNTYTPTAGDIAMFARSPIVVSYDSGVPAIVKNNVISGFSVNLTPTIQTVSGGMPRWHGTSSYPISGVSSALSGLPVVLTDRMFAYSGIPSYTFETNKTVDVYLCVHNRGTVSTTGGWSGTPYTTKWGNGEVDTVVRKTFTSGTITIPGHDGTAGADKWGRPYYGVAHMVIVSGGV
jgi:beta-glucanase (GH16 family)